MKHLVNRTTITACMAIVMMLGSAGHALAGGGCTSSPSTVDDFKYHNIIDHTQAAHLNVIVSNTQTVTGKSYPLTGACPNPWAGVDPALFPASGFTPPTPDLYVEVNVAHADLKNATLAGATVNTCNQGVSNYTAHLDCPGAALGDVPTTFVRRLGTESGGTVTPLPNTALSSGVEPLKTMFTVGGQAFDLDRLRYAANRLWYEWYLEKKTGETGNTGWGTKFTYQPTGTMSFETFIDNVRNSNPMYGLVRVVVPVDSSQDALFDASYPVHGAEFVGTPTWSGTAGGPGGSANEMWSYENSADAASSLTITVYGMLLFDYVDAATYDPANFFDDTQDYIDNYTDLATHDAASHTGKKNFILPRTSGRNVYIKNWDTLNINAVNDLETFVQYTDTHSAGGDGRMDTLDIVRRKYMMAGPPAVKNYAVAEISDAYVWEYWMRKAGDTSTPVATRTAILSDLASQYNIGTQTFAVGAARRTSFDGTEWGTLADKDKFHAYFPNGYERGWLIAFDALDLEGLDGGNIGSWWSQLTSDITVVASLGGGSLGKGYDPLNMPDTSKAENVITVDADGDGAADTVDGATSAIPNVFTAITGTFGWEDYPALAFAGGVLDMHGHANISGMLYTPDSAEIEAKSEKPAAFQYVNGAMLFGNGVILEGKSGQHSMIAIAYQYGTFDSLPIGNPKLWISPVQSIREIRGQ